jgi:hypothetical protein
LGAFRGRGPAKNNEKRRIVKAFNFVMAALLVSGVTATAQQTSTSRFEAGVNYSWLHVNSANFDLQRTGNGGSGYFEYNLNKIVGMVADFGGYANTRAGIDDTVTTYLAGPRFNWRHSRLNPYVQFLFGAAHVSNSPGGVASSQNAFATAAGGGLDYNWSRHISIKPIQVEYVTTQIGSPDGAPSHQNDARYSAGFVFKFGERH